MLAALSIHECAVSCATEKEAVIYSRCPAIIDAIQTCGMRILIAFNEPVLPASHPEAASEREVLDAVALIAAYLTLPNVELESAAKNS